MYYIKKCFFLFLLMTTVICFGQNKKIELEIIGDKTYNNLYIRAHQQHDNPVFAGETTDGSQWIFTVPDSIVKKTLYFDFRGQTPTGNRIGFLGIIQGDTLIGREIHFENDERLIRLKVEYHHTTHEVNYQYIPEFKKTVEYIYENKKHIC